MQFLKISAIRFHYRYAEQLRRFIFNCRFGASYALHVLLRLSLFANNIILNTDYAETELVPMPKVICYLGAI
jgi:hypothetical protein